MICGAWTLACVAGCGQRSGADEGLEAYPTIRFVNGDSRRCDEPEFGLYSPRDPRFPAEDDVGDELALLAGSRLRLIVASVEENSAGAHVRRAWEAVDVDDDAIARVEPLGETELAIDADAPGTTQLRVSRCGVERTLTVRVAPAAVWLADHVVATSPGMVGPSSERGEPVMSVLAARWLEQTVLLGDDAEVAVSLTPLDAEGTPLRGAAVTPDPALAAFVDEHGGNLDFVQLRFGPLERGEAVVLPTVPGSAAEAYRFEGVGVEDVAASTPMTWHAGGYKPVRGGTYHALFEFVDFPWEAPLEGDGVWYGDSPHVALVHYAEDGRRIYGLTRGLRWRVAPEPADDDWTGVPVDGPTGLVTFAQFDRRSPAYATTFHQAPAVVGSLAVGEDLVLTFQTPTGEQTVRIMSHTTPRPEPDEATSEASR